MCQSMQSLIQKICQILSICFLYFFCLLRFDESLKSGKFAYKIVDSTIWTVNEEVILTLVLLYCASKILLVRHVEFPLLR